MNSNLSPDEAVREAVAGADARRRTHDAVRGLAKRAPAAAGVALLTAAVGRLAGWPASVALGVLVVLAGALAVWVWTLGRPRPATDGVASRIDGDADFGGELRSAHWFASSPSRDGDAWSTFHVQQAAKRVSGVDWATLYPPAKAARAWAGTAALVAATLALSLWVVTPRTPSAAELAVAELAALADVLPPELQGRLDQLLASMEDGQITADDLATLEELQQLMSQLDPDLQEKLSQLAEDTQAGSEGEALDLSAEELAEMAENSAAGMPEDVRWALEDLAARLANENAESETNPENESATSETGESTPGAPSAESEDATAAEAGMQMMRQAASDAGESQMMMAGAGAMGGDSSAGEGGNSGDGSGDPEEFLSIAEALRQELIEAADDNLGENVLNEDIRRKTEQGTSSLGYSRVAPATFDRSRAVGPPQVPDARRPLLFNYFIRQR